MKLVIIVLAILVNCVCADDVVKKVDENAVKAALLPPLEEIESIEACMFNCPRSLPDIPSFTVRKESMKSVYALFANPTLDKSPDTPVTEIGYLRIKPKLGTTRLVTVYGSPFTGSLRFSLHGIRFRRPREESDVQFEELLFDLLIRREYEAITGKSMSTIERK